MCEFVLNGKRCFTCYGGYQTGKSIVTMFSHYDFVICATWLAVSIAIRRSMVSAALGFLLAREMQPATGLDGSPSQGFGVFL
jgi:hypothetical protein